MSSEQKLTKGGWSHIPDLTSAQRDLLLASGVPTVTALAGHDAAKLWRWMNEVNLDERHVRQMPSVEVVRGWVMQAVLQISSGRTEVVSPAFMRRAIA